MGGGTYAFDMHHVCVKLDVRVQAKALGVVTQKRLNLAVRRKIIGFLWLALRFEFLERLQLRAAHRQSRGRTAAS